MSNPVTAGHDCIILDACCVMNLYASRKRAEIISCMAETVAVAVYVMNVEALTVYRESKHVAPNDREAIELQPLIDKGVLITADLESDEEKGTLVEFAAQRLDDGEATTMAIACNRNWAVATDDRSARRVLRAEYDHIQIVSTPEIVKHWHENANPGAVTLRQAILDIEKRANYLVGSRHPLYGWWQSCKKGNY